MVAIVLFAAAQAANGNMGKLCECWKDFAPTYHTIASVPAMASYVGQFKDAVDRLESLCGVASGASGATNDEQDKLMAFFNCVSSTGNDRRTHSQRRALPALVVSARSMPHDFWLVGVFGCVQEGQTKQNCASASTKRSTTRHFGLESLAWLGLTKFATMWSNAQQSVPQSPSTMPSRRPRRQGPSQPR
jgi:hypothetical protein